ncbi:MAG: serine/threonine-protein kinase [Planctomycetota bacterium]
MMHRDVKPGNLLLTHTGQAKLIDFGLAESLNKQEDGQVVGSPYYMSPEIARGQVADIRADIYSLGASMYHMLTGQPPFRKQGASPRDIVLRRFKIPPPDPCEILALLHPETGRLCQMMMALDPENRPADYADVMSRLRQLATIIQRDHARDSDSGDALRALSEALDN